MIGSRPLRILTILAATSCVASSHAEAACNLLPTPDSLRSAADAAENTTASGGSDTVAKQLEKDSFDGAFPLKGALGRASRALVFPSEKAGIAIVADSVCVSRREPMARRNVSVKDDVVAAILYPAKSDADQPIVVARVFASNALCSALTAAPEVTLTPASHGGPRVLRILPDCSNTDVRLRAIPIREGTSTYALDLPVKPVPPEAAASVSPNVRIAMLQAGTAQEVRAQLGSLAAADASCASLCGDAATGAKLDACIDGLYTTLPAIQVGQSTKFALDSVACNVAIVPDLDCDSNDFQELCSSADVTGFASCKDSDPELEFWQSNCGGIHFPFSWKSIRTDPAPCQDPSGECYLDRVVSGSSGLARKQKAAGMGERFYLPGREFVGSTNCVSDCQNPPCTEAGDWRLPDVDLWSPDGPGGPFGLTGVVDKNQSVVHLFPALQAVLECEVPNDPTAREACTGVGYYQGKQRTVCACADRYAADCACKPLVTDPQFYTCQAPPGWPTGQPYAYEAMPCTRHNHCPEGGYCRGKQQCIAKKDSVWGNQPHVPGTKDCASNGDCVGNQACGYRLFDVSDRIDVNKGTGKLFRKLDGAGDKKDRRGVCRDNPKARCNKPDECANNADCTGFALRADGKP